MAKRAKLNELDIEFRRPAHPNILVPNLDNRGLSPYATGIWVMLLGSMKLADVAPSIIDLPIKESQTRREHNLMPRENG